MKYLIAVLGASLVFAGCAVRPTPPVQEMVVDDSSSLPDEDLDTIEAELDNLDAAADFGTFSENDF